MKKSLWLLSALFTAFAFSSCSFVFSGDPFSSIETENSSTQTSISVENPKNESIEDGSSEADTSIQESVEEESSVTESVEDDTSEEIIDPVVTFNVNGTYMTAEPTLDLRALTIINATEYTDLKYTVKSGTNNVDQSRISEGVVTFLKRGVCKIEVSLVYKGETYTAAMTAIFQPEEEIQSITLSKTELA